MASDTALCFPCLNDLATFARYEGLRYSRDATSQMSRGICEARSSLCRDSHVRRRLSGRLKVELRATARGWKDQATELFGLCLPCLQARDELCRDGNLTFTVVLRAESVLWLISDGDRRPCQIDICPRTVHHLLFAHSRHQEKLIPQTLFLIAHGEQLLQFLAFVNLRFFLNESGPVILAHQSTNALCLQECHYVLELVDTLLGDCCFTSRRNAENFSKSLRSMSAKYIFGQDSWKYFRAVEYAAYVFGFF